VIARCLASLLADAHPQEFDIVVVPNGCHDRTAEVAAEFGRAVQVVPTSLASKTEALNIGDAASITFPRIYLDADIEISARTARELVSALDEPGVMFATPQLNLDLSEASSVVRAYYRVWLQLPYRDHSHLGRGTIALSREARQRFAEFPAVIADDLYMRRLFLVSECRTLQTGVVTIRPPSSLQELIRVKSRVIAANLQYRHLRLQRLAERAPSRMAALRRLQANRSSWPDIGIYLAITAAIRVRAHAKRRFGHMNIWERDDTARDAGIAADGTSGRTTHGRRRRSMRKPIRLHAFHGKRDE
jgi:glycosyltransferase involved in cell wall biosynthesis